MKSDAQILENTIGPSENVKFFPKPVHAGPPTHAEGEFYVLTPEERQFLFDLDNEAKSLQEAVKSVQHQLTGAMKMILRARGLQNQGDTGTWSLTPDATMFLKDKPKTKE